MTANLLNSDVVRPRVRWLGSSSRSELAGDPRLAEGSEEQPELGYQIVAGRREKIGKRLGYPKRIGRAIIVMTRPTVMNSACSAMTTQGRGVGAGIGEARPVSLGN